MAIAERKASSRRPAHGSCLKGQLAQLREELYLFLKDKVHNNIDLDEEADAINEFVFSRIPESKADLIPLLFQLRTTKASTGMYRRKSGGTSAIRMGRQPQPEDGRKKAAHAALMKTGRATFSSRKAEEMRTTNEIAHRNPSNGCFATRVNSCPLPTT